jgi:hypothetical protein
MAISTACAPFFEATICRINIAVNFLIRVHARHGASAVLAELRFQLRGGSGLASVQGHQCQESRSTRSCSRSAAFARNPQPLVGVGSLTNPYASRPT